MATSHHNEASSIALAVNVVQVQGARSRQEDSYLVRDTLKGLLVLVADGLGGHERGDEASRIACLTAFQAIEKALLKPGSISSALRKAFVLAHKAVQQIPAPHRRSPASTLVGGFFSTETQEFHGASIGDSLVILFREGQVSWLFRPQVEGDVIIHALGVDIGDARGSAVELLDPMKLQPGDKLLFASDGIEALWEEQILTSLALPSAKESAERIARVLISMQREHQDNATVVVVQVKAA